MSYGYDREGYEEREPYPPSEYAQDGYGPEGYAQDGHARGEYPGGGYQEPGYPGPEQYAAPDPAAAGRGRRRRSAPEPEPEPQPEPAPYDRQWEQSGLGWDQRAWNEAQQAQQEYREPTDYREPGYDPPGYSGYDREPQYFEARPSMAERTSVREAPDRYSEPKTEPEYPSENAGPAPAPVPAPSPSTGGVTGGSLAGRGAFGAAGLAVVTGIGAIAATPVLAIVAGLSQIGLAVGWSRTVGMPNARRTVVLVAAVGLAATALGYRLAPERAPGAMGAALGVGFVFLAADQLFRRDTGAGRHRSEALAAAVTGAAFAVLPAGYLVAQRQDSKLAGACALAAAVAVLASALVGGGGKPISVLAGVAAATAVGALTAVSLSAAAGVKGGAAGGLAAGLFAVAAARVADRLGAEGADVRISSQALPVAFSAIGAVIISQMLR